MATTESKNVRNPAPTPLRPTGKLGGEVPEFLIAFLSAGPVPVKEIEEAAAAQLISKRTLERAKEDLHIIVDKDSQCASSRGGPTKTKHFPKGG
jgi:hypothetical protein